MQTRFNKKNTQEWKHLKNVFIEKNKRKHKNVFTTMVYSSSSAAWRSRLSRWTSGSLRTVSSWPSSSCWPPSPSSSPSTSPCLASHTSPTWSVLLTQLCSSNEKISATISTCIPTHTPTAAFNNKKAVLSQRRPRDALLLCNTDAISVWSSNKGTIQRRKQRAWQMPCRNYGLRPGPLLVSPKLL